MATEVVTLLRDDVDGTAAERTISFSWDGSNYEIDLSKKNIAELTAALAPFVSAGRRLSGRSRGGRPARVGRSTRASTSPRSDVDLAAVREWALANGHSISARGRISADVLGAFQEASTTANKATTKPSRQSGGATPARKRAARPTGKLTPVKPAE